MVPQRSGCRLDEDRFELPDRFAELFQCTEATGHLLRVVSIPIADANLQHVETAELLLRENQSFLVASLAEGTDEGRMRFDGALQTQGPSYRGVRTPFGS